MDGPTDDHAKWHQRKTNMWYHLDVESKGEKKSYNELIDKAETDFQSQKTNLRWPKGKGEKS